MPIAEQILNDLKQGKPNSRILNLAEMELNDKDMLDLFAATPEGWKFFHIVLTNNKITSGGAQILSQLSIKRLDLDDNNIGNIGAKYLAQNRFTTHLNLSNNKLTDKGAKYFEANDTLEVLDLTGNKTSNTESAENSSAPSTLGL